jgi:hypothetical protein
MSALTVAEAITRVGDLLDDPNNIRWPTTKVTGALKVALSVCVQEYGDAGGTAFDESITGTTSSAGALVVASPVISRIKSVQVVTGNRRVVIRGCRPQDIEIYDAAARDLAIVIDRDWQVSSTTTNQLVGDDAATGPSWFAFDQWVCAQAALDLGISDNDKRPGLEASWARYREAVLSRVQTPRSRVAPLPRSDYTFTDNLGWTWDQTTATVQLGRMRGEWW